MNFIFQCIHFVGDFGAFFVHIGKLAAKSQLAFVKCIVFFSAVCFQFV